MLAKIRGLPLSQHHLLQLCYIHNKHSANIAIRLPSFSNPLSSTKRAPHHSHFPWSFSWSDEASFAPAVCSVLISYSQRILRKWHSIARTPTFDNRLEFAPAYMLLCGKNTMTVGEQWQLGRDSLTNHKSNHTLKTALSIKCYFASPSFHQPFLAIICVTWTARGYYQWNSFA